jgi:CPA2 family monovalent cation:H+ antiporter-2
VSPLDLVLLLAVATIGVLVGRALRVPPTVSYLAAGVLVGPGGLAWITRSDALEQLAEFGVALLLFGVGIEFSLERLRRILGRMLLAGGLQIAVTVVMTAVAFRTLGTPWTTALFVGFLVSLSSTAIVFKLYDDAGELDTPHGLAAAGILLLQDLALVPMILLIPVLSGSGEGTVAAAAKALAAGCAAVGVLLLLARVVLPRALRLLARAGVPELFPLAALVIAFGTALAAARMGLSLPIGAFLAGLALSASPHAQQVFAELLPLRDVFVAVFFTSIGMLLEPAAVVVAPRVFAAMVGSVLVKGGIIALVVAVVWRSTRIALVTGVALAQIGEFAFVLAREGAAAGLLPARVQQPFLGTAVLTMAATPFLIRLARRLAPALERGATAGEYSVSRDHVLVIGYGITGTAVARVLRETGIPFVAVDLVAEVVDEGRREGLPVRFGDASRRAVLEEMGAAQARAAVVALGDPVATRRCVSLLRQLSPTIRILVRARRVGEIAELERLGADEVIPSEFETSIELLVRLLMRLGVPRHVVRVQESLIRLDHYQALRGVGATPELLNQARKLVMGGILETAQVMAGSAAAGRTLAELDLRRRTGATVLTVVRADAPLPTPDGPTALEAGDLVVLYGPHEAIDHALRLLEPGGTDATRAAP